MVTGPARRGAEADQARAAALITVCWPHPVIPAPGQDANTLAGGCQQHLDHDESTIAAAVIDGVAGTGCGEYENSLPAAAEAAGLRPLRDIVSLAAKDGRDFFSSAITHDTTAACRDIDCNTSRYVTGITPRIFRQPRKSS